MKKYYQLVLLVITGFSLLCFVFYKHEYDRLRKVLEVLDFFGSAGSTSTDRTLPSPLEITCPTQFTKVSSDHWLDYSDSLHFYTAYKVSHDKGWSINSLAMITNDFQPKLGTLSCALITGELSSDSYEGTIEWKEIGRNHSSQSTAYTVTCNVPELQSLSHLFSIYDTKSPGLPVVNIPLHNEMMESDDSIGSVNALCVVPSHPYWQSKEIIRFILFYASLGVDHFYLYHLGISDEVISTLNKVVAQRNLVIHLLPWNLPRHFGRGESELFDFPLILTDCAWRQNGRMGSVASIQMGHYIIPHEDISLEIFLKKIKPSADSVYQARIEAETLCSNTVSRDPTILKKWKLKKKKLPPLNQHASSAYLRWSDPSLTNNRLEEFKVDPLTAKVVVLEHCLPVAINVLSDDSDHMIDRFADMIAGLPMVV